MSNLTRSGLGLCCLIERGNGFVLLSGREIRDAKSRLGVGGVFQSTLLDALLKGRNRFVVLAIGVIGFAELHIDFTIGLLGRFSGKRVKIVTRREAVCL